MSYKRVKSYLADKPVLAYGNGNYFAKSITAVGDDIPLDENARRTIPTGMFWAVDLAGAYRPLPRAKVVTAIGTGSPNITVSPIAGFKVGDILRIVEPYTALTITAVEVGQTQTITVNGSTATATATTTAVGDLALLVKQAVENTYPLNSYIYCVVSAGVVYIFPKDGKTLYGVTEGGSATATLSGATLTYNATAIGTISSINGETGVITLGANAGVAVPAGIGIGASVKEVVGLTCGAMDFSDQNRINLALLTASSGVRIEMLPYFEESFRTQFPKIRFDYNI